MGSRHPFDMLVELPARHIRLDCAALHLARDESPHLNLGVYLRRLDRLAEEVADCRPGLSAPLRYEAMRTVLCARHEFRGNTDEYYDPRNCYLNHVLDRRTGMPITLSIVWMEVARRLKWPVGGVALPGHFIVRFDDPERFVLADPFHDGRTLSLADCRKLARRQPDGGGFSRRRLQPVGVRAVLARLLGNLRCIYLAQRDWQRVAAVLQRLMALEPHRGRHLRDLAAVYARQGDVRGAHGCLTAYLDRAPDARDVANVQCNLRRLEAALAAMN